MTLQVQCENARALRKKGYGAPCRLMSTAEPRYLYTLCCYMCMWCSILALTLQVLHFKCRQECWGREGRIWGSVSAADPKPAAAALESSRPPSSLSSQMGESSSRFERGKMGSNSMHSKLPHHLMCGETGQTRRQQRWKSEDSGAKG